LSSIQTQFDIAICGAGPVGQALALFLIKTGVAPQRLVLIDAKTRQQSEADPRSIALSWGSYQLLQSVNSAPTKSTAIHQIHVSRKAHFGRTLIDRNDHQVSALGYVTRYADIIQPLSAALDRTDPALHFLRPVKVVNITQSDTSAQVELNDQRVIQAQIVVQAEGGLFNEQGAQSRHCDYQQCALIASVKTSKPIAARAYERFTDQGPLALLPQDDGYALVWCVSPELADRLMTLDDATFLSELQNAFGDRVGQFTHATPRASFALGLNAQTDLPSGRVIGIGNAAQTLHPVAGQGLNLGLRDAYLLAQLLSRSLSPESLQTFFQTRQADRTQTVQLTDRLATLFTSKVEHSPTQALLGLGLGLMDITPPAQRWLAGQMMFGKR
jgi:2-octaprenyl-6-methoxyphenol hydroxylase